MKIRELKQIVIDRHDGKCLSVHQSAILESAWLKVYGTGGCYYPDVTENDMLQDMIFYHGINTKRLEKWRKK